MPFYPGCTTHPRVPMPVSRIFMAFGEKDDYADMKPCQDLAEDYRGRAAPSRSRFTRTGHTDDGNPANIRMTQLRTVENYVGCLLYLGEDGQVVHDGKRYRPDETRLIVELRKTCVTKGASI